MTVMLCTMRAAVATAAPGEPAHHVLHARYDVDGGGVLNMAEVKQLWDDVAQPASMTAVDAMVECVQALQPGGVAVPAGAEGIDLDDGVHPILLGAVLWKVRRTCLAENMHGAHDNHNHNEHDEASHAHTPDYLLAFVRDLTRVAAADGFNATMLTRMYEALVPMEGRDAPPADGGTALPDACHDDHVHRRVTHSLDVGVDEKKCVGVAGVLAAAGVEPGRGVEVAGARLVGAVETAVVDTVMGCTRSAVDNCSRPSRAEQWGYTVLAVTVVTAIAAAVFVIVVPLTGTHPVVLEMFLAFALGALIGDVFLHIVPIVLGVHNDGGGGDAHAHGDSALSNAVVRGRMLVICGTIWAFYLVEYACQVASQPQQSDGDAAVSPKSATAMSCHPQSCDSPSEPAFDPEQSSAGVADAGGAPRRWLSAMEFTCVVWVVILADAVHNTTDGLALGAAFARNTRLGWTTFAAVAFHEIPQEVGDFALLLAAGLPPSQALALNLLSGAMALLAGIVAVAVSESTDEAESWFLCVAAGSFLYLALAVIAPQLVCRLRGFVTLQLGAHCCGAAGGVLVMWVIAVTEDHDECAH